MKIQGIQLKQLARPTYISVPTRESAEQLEDFLFSKGIYWHSGRSEEDTTPRAVLNYWYSTHATLAMVLSVRSGNLHLHGSGVADTPPISLKQFMALQANIRRR